MTQFYSAFNIVCSFLFYFPFAEIGKQFLLFTDLAEIENAILEFLMALLHRHFLFGLSRCFLA